MSANEKKSNSWQMFDAISPTYDRVNRILSMGLDLRWRRALASYLPKITPLRLLDVATGTGDQIFALAGKWDQATGIDLSTQMLALAKKKAAAQRLQVEFLSASALKLPFEDKSFDVATISFGIRNVADVTSSLREMRRILASGGKALILEFSQPKNPLLRHCYLFYLRHLLPPLGSLLSQSPSAYRYLNTTIEDFPYGEAFCALLRNEGFCRVESHPMMAGIVTLYEATRP